jgi:hypothetical protein
VAWPSAPKITLSPGAKRVLTRTAVVVALTVNAILLVVTVRGLLFAPSPPDWQGLVDAANRIASGANPYVGQTYAFRWSPLAAWLLVPFTAAGLQVWQLLHFAALLVLPRSAILISVACFAFWVDVAMGNVVTFGFVLAYMALSGRRHGAVAFTVFALLVPRPLYIPLLVWLWLRQPTERRWMVAAAVVIGVLTLATGYAGSWFEILRDSTGDIANATNMAPSALIGYAWVPVGIVLSILAFRRGWIGTASLLFSPYWLPYYFQMVVLDLIRRPKGEPSVI